jgi:Zn-dependent membrane protease YugP
MFLIIFLCAMAVGLLAHWHVRRTYARDNRVPTLSCYTGAETASDILAQAEGMRVVVREV